MAKSETKNQNEHSKNPVPIGKQRYWWAVLWNENMAEDWQDNADELIQHPYCYCIHNKDVDQNGEIRKTHTHMILAFPGPTTYKRALSVFQRLGEKAVNSCEAVLNMRFAYNYLIHDTESSRKKKKYQYKVEERHSCNNFDIGQYEQLSSQLKNEMLAEILDFVIDTKLQNMADFMIIARTKFSTPEYFEVIKGNNSFIEKVCRGNYLKYTNTKDKKTPHNTTKTPHNTTKNCPDCWSLKIRKDGKIRGKQRFCCKECGRKFC